MENRKHFLTLYAILIAGFLFLGYIYKTNNDAKIAWEREKLEAAKQADIDELKQQEADEEKRKADLATCLANAASNADDAWNSTCQQYGASEEEEYRSCLNECAETNVICGNETDNASFCRNMHPAIPSTACGLPVYMADRINETEKEENDHCYELYKSE